MALVSYGSSSESEGTGEEDDQQTELQRTHCNQGAANENTTLKTGRAGRADTPTPTSQCQPVTESQLLDDSTNLDCDISDEDDDVEVSFDQRNVTRLCLPPPKSANSNVVSMTNVPLTSVNDHAQTPHSALMSGLPAPKHPGVKTTSTEDDELEDLVKPKTYGEKVAEKPNKRQRTTIRVSLPDLAQDDSDEEDDLITRKKLKQGPSKAGLFGLLPPPVNASVKETNRPLVPHTLTRKPSRPPPKPSTVKQTPAAKHKPLVIALHSDDDDEEDEVNFFSLGNNSASQFDQSLSSTAARDISVHATGGKTSGAVSDAPQVTPNASTDFSEQTGDTSPRDRCEPDESVNGPGESVSQGDESVKQEDEPLQFRADHPSVVGPGWRQVTSHQNQDSWTSASEVTTSEQMESNAGASFDLESLSHDEQFLRMQGKRGRGREEITFRDVSADDQMNLAALEMTKTLSEEAPTSSKKNKDGGGPTSQQKRKHQITYLAHKAREREFDLKNQWAMNRATRAQTQSKYGF